MPSRSAYYAGITLIGVFGGYWVGFALLGMDDARGFVFSAQGAAEILVLSLIISAILASIFLARERQALAEAAFQRERARVEAAEHQFHLAQLKLLEAQIEPHFLYNTLANVISLVDADPAVAKRMVARLDRLSAACGPGRRYGRGDRRAPDRAAAGIPRPDGLAHQCAHFL